MKALGEPRHFLGMQITFERDESGKRFAVQFSNEKLMNDMLESFCMSNCQKKSVPLNPGMELKKGNGGPLPPEKTYRELVGGLPLGLFHLSITVRPDIAHVSGLLGRFFNLTSHHWAASWYACVEISGWNQIFWSEMG